jgi:protein-ribulosamine 3-kinase
MKDTVHRLLTENKIIGQILSIDEVSGGCINRAFRVRSAPGELFIKINSGPHKDILEKESDGLELLRSSGAIRVPVVIRTGIFQEHTYLALEQINAAPRTADYWRTLGAQLAALHRHSNGEYGLHFDNYIGSLPQANNFHADWLQFFIVQRLEVQLALAGRNGTMQGIRKKMEKLYVHLPDILCMEQPALLHGDLWSGNVMADEHGKPCFIDPAVYYGHREAELAFTTLFGGFDAAFYESYHSHFPLSPGYEQRFDIYNLYPLLVHHNLFGGGYLNAAATILNKFQ